MSQQKIKDHWIYKNSKALNFLMKGIKDAGEGRINDRGSFSQYAKTDEIQEKRETTILALTPHP